MTTLRACTQCNRHIRAEETACPFCGCAAAASSEPARVDDASPPVFRLTPMPLYGAPAPPMAPMPVSSGDGVSNATRSSLLLVGMAVLLVTMGVIAVIVSR